MSGRTCANRVCVTRNTFCDQACASRGGWTPNPQGCYWWSIRSNDTGTGGNYTSARSGCASGYSLGIDRPDNPAGYRWCIPGSAVCAGPADCPGDWSCEAPVTARNTSGTYRFCMPPQTPTEAGTFCNWK